MVNKVRIMTQCDAVIHSYRADIKSCVIVSITCANDTTPAFYKPNSLHKDDIKVKGIFDMHFDDIDHYIKGFREPRSVDFVGLKSFIDKYKNEVEEIVVHCHAGISRSSACASAICKYLGLDYKNIWGSGDYVPNRLVFKLALNELNEVISEEELEELYNLNAYVLNNVVNINSDMLGDLFI